MSDNGVKVNFEMGEPTRFSTPKPKTSVFDELISVLRKFLGYCLWCCSCGCVPHPSSRYNANDLYDTSLSDAEREAVQSLLRYLDSYDSKDPTINDERLRALCILTYSDNLELQRSAALCFADISENMRTPLTDSVMEPLCILLESRDPQVQRPASLAVSNFSLYGPGVTKRIIVESGAIDSLVKLLSSKSPEVQCNTCATITTLATKDDNKEILVEAGAIPPLIELLKSKDIKVLRNASGAVLNFTHLKMARDYLVQFGAIPILVQSQNSKDPDVQYYCTAALGNIAVHDKYRTMMIGVGHFDVIRQLLVQINSPTQKVRCQACLALRNLACDADNQYLIVRYDGLPILKNVIATSEDDTLIAAMACLQNLSIHKSNEVPIMCETFLPELLTILTKNQNMEARIHAAGVIRNLAAGEHVALLINAGLVDALSSILLSTKDPVPYELIPLLREITAALAILADEDDVKEMIIAKGHGKLFTLFVHMINNVDDEELIYNCAGIIGQLATIDLESELLRTNFKNLFSYISSFIRSNEAGNIHISLWTLLHLLKYQEFKSAFRDQDIFDEILKLSQLELWDNDALKQIVEEIKKELEND